MSNPCVRQGHHVFIPGELGILRAGGPCTCGETQWVPGGIVPRDKSRAGVPLLNKRVTVSWSAEQIERNKEAAELLPQAEPANQLEEDFVANLQEWVDTHKPVTERQLDKLRQVVNHDYEHYTDSQGYF